MKNYKKTSPPISNFFKKTLFREGEDVKIEDIKTLLSKQNEKIECLEAQLDILTSKKNEVPITRDEVLDFTSKLNKIEDYLRKILG